MEKVFRIHIFIHVSLILLAVPGYSLCESKAPERISLGQITTKLFKEHPGKSGAFVLEKGEDALLTRAWLTDRSVRTIDVQYFIWSTDNIGILAAESLLRAAERGTRIRVIVDDFLIDAPAESMVALATHPNVEVRIYNPNVKVGVTVPEKAVGFISNFRSLNQRMHDKTFIVDGLVAITGGRNMADEYFDYDHEYNFRDRDILLLGPVVEEMQHSFELFWQSRLTIPVEELLIREKKRLKKERIAEIYQELHAYAEDPENFAPEVRESLNKISDVIPLYVDKLTWEDIVFVSDVPGKNPTRSLWAGGRSTEMLIDAVKKAKKSITIQSPYLVLPKDGIDFFAKLIEKGVEVRINTNSLAATDNLLAFSGYSKQRRVILKAGIKVFEFKPDPAIQKDLIDRYAELEKLVPTFAIHAKTMVIDGEVVFIGTFNLDPRSANLNTEIGVLIRNKKLAEQVEGSILRDMLPENSWSAANDKPDRQAPFWKQLKIGFFKIMPVKALL